MRGFLLAFAVVLAGFIFLMIMSTEPSSRLAPEVARVTPAEACAQQFPGNQALANDCTLRIEVKRMDAAIDRRTADAEAASR